MIRCKKKKKKKRKRVILLLNALQEKETHYLGKLNYTCRSRVPDQNGVPVLHIILEVPLLYIMLEIHHSGRESSISKGENQNCLSQNNPQKFFNNNNNNKTHHNHNHHHNHNNNDNDCIEKRSSRFLQSPHCARNCLQHVCTSCQGTIVCKSRATDQAQHVVCHMVQRDSSATKFDRV